jgi:hypothetical protein
MWLSFSQITEGSWVSCDTLEVTPTTRSTLQNASITAMWTVNAHSDPVEKSLRIYTPQNYDFCVHVPSSEPSDSHGWILVAHDGPEPSCHSCVILALPHCRSPACSERLLELRGSWGSSPPLSSEFWRVAQVESIHMAMNRMSVYSCAYNEAYEIKRGPL